MPRRGCRRHTHSVKALVNSKLRRRKRNSNVRGRVYFPVRWEFRSVPVALPAGCSLHVWAHISNKKTAKSKRKHLSYAQQSPPRHVFSTKDLQESLGYFSDRRPPVFYFESLTTMFCLSRGGARGGNPDFVSAKTTPRLGIFGVCTPWVVLRVPTERIAAAPRGCGGAGL